MWESFVKRVTALNNLRHKNFTYSRSHTILYGPSKVWNPTEN